MLGGGGDGVCVCMCVPWEMVLDVRTGNLGSRIMLINGPL